MNCIVLAFSTVKDLPHNHNDFTIVDCYGECSEADTTKLAPNIVVHQELFEVGKTNLLNTLYNDAFIRHPDPWGEPRNWMQAIAALGECLQGHLTCEFWYPHEIIAFHFLLTSILSSEQVMFVHAQQIEDANEWDNYSASWEINAVSLQADMLAQYQKEKQGILQYFYTNIGIFYRDISIEQVKPLINSLPTPRASQ